MPDISLQNLSDHEVDLSRSLKVKCESAIGFPIYGFPLMFNSNIGLGDLEFKVKCHGAVGLPLYDDLLVSNSNYMYVSNSHRLGVIVT